MTSEGKNVGKLSLPTIIRAVTKRMNSRCIICRIVDVCSRCALVCIGTTPWYKKVDIKLPELPVIVVHVCV